MGILGKLKSKFRPRADKAASPRLDPEQFIYVKLPGNIQPIQRGEQFEDRIEPVLAESKLGSVSGGGSSLTDPLPDGRRLVSFCGIDVDTPNRDAALTVLRDLLPTLNAPVGTELHYTRDGTKLQDEFSGAGWATNRPRTDLHSGFEV